MATKKRFTVDEHKEVARVLHPMCKELSSLLVKVGNAYPASSTVSKAAYRAANTVERLRSELDDCLCREHPDFKLGVTKFYYGKDDALRQS